ncbi:hypothetical protein LCGC14_2288140 [marine sediment metagenome]|uniref:Uncharacterized protein n=1 Tax=marine sediment metagenome TaxID=412755 RepID=A0A0F9F4J8_9ZZZZ
MTGETLDIDNAHVEVSRKSVLWMNFDDGCSLELRDPARQNDWEVMLPAGIIAICPHGGRLELGASWPRICANLLCPLPDRKFVVDREHSKRRYCTQKCKDSANNRTKYAKRTGG